MTQEHSPRKNWAGNYAYRAEKLHRPSTIEQVQEIVANAPSVRVLGSRHSFNDIADSSAKGPEPSSLLGSQPIATLMDAHQSSLLATAQKLYRHPSPPSPRAPVTPHRRPYRCAQGSPPCPPLNPRGARRSLGLRPPAG